MAIAAVPTQKAKLFAYVPPELKALLEQLADRRHRSLSNLIESVLADEVNRAIAQGEISPPKQNPQP